MLSNSGEVSCSTLGPWWDSNPRPCDPGLCFLEEEGFYYLCSENKGADQLRSYCAADQLLCFRIYAKRQFSHDMSHIEPGSVKHGLEKSQEL